MYLPAGEYASVSVTAKWVGAWKLSLYFTHKETSERNIKVSTGSFEEARHLIAEAEGLNIRVTFSEDARRLLS